LFLFTRKVIFHLLIVFIVRVKILSYETLIKLNELSNPLPEVFECLMGYSGKLMTKILK
jgi:hypothetical protein